MNQQALAAKQSAVKEIIDGVHDNASLTVVSYQGLTVAEISQLRKALEKVDATFTVYKNTMVRRALKDIDQPDLGEVLEGPNAFVFSKEPGTGPKALLKFARSHECLKVKAALADGRVYDEKGVKDLSKILDKNGMLSMFLSCLKAPTTKFAATVKAIADKQAPAAAN
ncbi:MAG: 50S ribosomal protein L10 [Bacilli bacterium]|nr:50S ribosomal protein L10 [Bacilli bacterium]